MSENTEIQTVTELPVGEILRQEVRVRDTVTIRHAETGTVVTGFVVTVLTSEKGIEYVTIASVGSLRLVAPSYDLDDVWILESITSSL